MERIDVGISCMLNTEINAVLAVVRRVPDDDGGIINEEGYFYDTGVIQSLKSIRSLIFNPRQEWRTVDPLVYISPFLDVIQNDDVPAAATGIALSAILKILELETFDVECPGARDAINSLAVGVISCRLERTDHVFEDAITMRILLVLNAIMRCRASVLLTDNSVCTIVNACFQVVQQSVGRGDLLQRNARHTVHELIQIIFSRLYSVEVESVNEDDNHGISLNSGFGIHCAIDIFSFLCSLLDVVQATEMESSTKDAPNEDVHLLALVLINTAIGLSGDVIGKHPKLLNMIQDDLFYYLIHHGTMCTSPLVLSVISSTVMNIYRFLRRFVRLQLEAFFEFVLLTAVAKGGTLQLHEIALEAIINFCMQPTFIIEAYTNYDCDPTCRNIFEQIGKLLCRLSFAFSSPLSPTQIQSFEGLLILMHNIANSIDRDGISGSIYDPVQITEYRPFWEEKSKNDDYDDDGKSWVEYIMVRKKQKKKISIAGSHFNRDEKKGFEYLMHARLVSEPTNPKDFAIFFRYTLGLDKNMIGEYLGDPEEFHIRVLKEFVDTFEFKGMTLETALRAFLAAFRLPGESQKIQRILEAFSEKYYDQQCLNILASKDAALILCYSLIMLNTDQHNPQVKKKMTEEEFIRNNRAINGGQDLPREYLSQLYQSIVINAISLSQCGLPSEMNPSAWIELINRSKRVQPLTTCDFDPRLGIDMFACVAGPAIAALSAFFQHVEEDEMLHECVEGFISVARIAQYGLHDILDELISSLSKFTTLLNPFASADETLFAFSNDFKARMATLTVFTVANNFGDSIRGGWRNIVDCLLKLKRLKLLPQSVVEFGSGGRQRLSNIPTNSRNESDGVIFPSHDPKFHHHAHGSGMISQFSHFLSIDSKEESVIMGISEFEQNLKIIKQCRIDSIFSNSSKMSEEALLHLNRYLIFAAAGKGQKFSTPVEEEETVGFCWDLIVAISLDNIHRFHLLCPSLDEYLVLVSQFPLFSPLPFAEKAVVGLFKICLKLLSSSKHERLSEEMIFKSINLMWKLDKEILDTCAESITKAINKIIVDHSPNLQSHLAWKSLLYLLSIVGRHPETYDEGVETIITLLSDTNHVTRTNYAYCVDCAFGFIALKNSPLGKNLKILDLLSDSVKLLIKWNKDYSDPGSNYSATSNTSNSSMEENTRGFVNAANTSMNCFIRLGEALRKTSLARREEIRNHGILSLRKSFRLADELELSPTNRINCLNHVVFAMVDDLHEKMVEYSRRDNAEREMRSMEGTLKLAMDLLVEVYLQFLNQIATSPGFKTFWLGLLRRMDTCMKADLGRYGETRLQATVPDLLRKMIVHMKNAEVFVHGEVDDDLWEITYIQIQWMAPFLKDELFPDIIGF